MKRNKGFTLIELLVVIAIIGILSSVVLASLNTARNKGKDASATSSFTAIRASAEMYYNGTGANSYGPANVTVVGTGVCADTDVAKLITAANTQTGNTAVCTTNSAVAAAATSYTAYITLLGSVANHAFCVDSTGFAGDALITGGTYSAGVKCK